MAMTRWAIALLMLCACTLARAESRVFDLHNADPEALVPVVKPMLGPWETVSPYRQSLVVNASAATLDRIGMLLAELDRPLKTLLVSMRRRPASAAAAIATRDDTLISTRERDEVRAVRVLETHRLLLRNGRLRALPAGGLLGPEVLWEELQEGLALSARVMGDVVTVDLELRDDGGDEGGIRKLTLHTAVQGRLGEWLPLSDNESRPRDAGSPDDIGTHERSDKRFEIRVDLAP